MKRSVHVPVVAIGTRVVDRKIWEGTRRPVIANATPHAEWDLHKSARAEETMRKLDLLMNLAPLAPVLRGERGAKSRVLLDMYCT